MAHKSITRDWTPGYRKGRKVVLGIICCIVGLLAPELDSQTVPPLSQRLAMIQGASSGRPSSEAPSYSVFGLLRSQTKDIAVLRNGSRLTGELLTRQFSIRMATGLLTIDVEMIAGIDRGQESSDIEVIATTGNDRFSGFLLEDSILFRIGDSEEPVRIRREEIGMMLLRVRENDGEYGDGSHFVTLKNGGYFRGTVSRMGESLLVSRRIQQIGFREIATLIFSSQKDPVAMALLKNGDVLRGEVRRDDIEIELSIGGVLKIHPERISMIDFARGVEGNLDTLGYATAVYISNEADQYEWSLSTGSLRVVSIAPDSEYYGALRSRDQIVALDGIPYSEVKARRYRGHLGRFTPMRAELIDGVRHQIFVTVKRRGELLLFRILRK